MKITEQVDLPSFIMKKHSEGNLVIFAGAGVSRGSPSNLPDFKELSSKISHGALRRKKGEPIDSFLGRLKDHGTRVHERAYEIINNPRSKPTKFHKAIISIFSSSQDVRLITTNFDRHFSSASEDIFGDRVDTNFAPALPLGKDFKGLVYLHGSIDKTPQNLILTDIDFGRAYISDAWATRFLKDVFESNVVLFIGYSHNDPLMGYLARSLSPNTERFVLSGPGYDTSWRLWGITPIYYPFRKGIYKHEELYKSLKAWANIIKMGALDHERRIREIVKYPPPTNPEDSDYMKEAIKDIVKLRFFTRYASTPEWLEWAENEGIFVNLFTSGKTVDEISQETASWFSDKFVYNFADEALALIMRQGQILNETLWNAIITRLAYIKPHPDSKLLAKWIPVLLSSPPSPGNAEKITTLLERCLCIEDSNAAFLLFDFLTKPRLKLERGFSFTKQNKADSWVDADIIIEGDDYWLKESWKKYFLPNIKDLYERIITILTTHLTQANVLLQSFGKAEGLWDHTSYRRAAIENHHQNSREKFDFLINTARNVIEWMSKNKHAEARYQIEAWSKSSVPILKRLGIFGMAESPRIRSDTKILWLLDKNWLYKLNLKHEVFRLLQNSYPGASKEIRIKLINEVIKGLPKKFVKKVKKRSRDYAIYNLLVWLNKADPDCPLVSKQLKVMQAKHPKFAPREHPDFDFWIDAMRAGDQSPLAVEELLKKNPQKEINWFLSYRRKEEIKGPNRKGLLNNISQAITQAFDWGWQLVEALSAKGQWDSDLWESIFWGWRESKLTDKQWSKILNFLQKNEQLYNFRSILPSFIENGARKECFPFECIELVEDFSIRFFEVCKQVKEKYEIDEDLDWLDKAINHPAGTITKIFLNTLSRRRARVDQEWSGLPKRHQIFFKRVLTERNYSAQMGRILLASKIHFLFAMDSTWTLKYILPLLDWSKEKRRAQQAWHGFLSWGKWDEAYLPQLLPYYVQTFSRLSAEKSTIHDSFCDHLASIAILSLINPLKHGWLRKFLKNSEINSHVKFADLIKYLLDELDTALIRKLWDSWINDYWTLRIDGIPRLLSENENENMIAWAIPLEPVFPAVVNKICAVSPPKLKHTSLYRRLSDGNFADNHPESLARLLKHLLPNAQKPFWHCDELEKLIRGLIRNKAPKKEIEFVCDEIAKLGCKNAGELKVLAESELGLNTKN